MNGNHASKSEFPETIPKEASDSFLFIPRHRWKIVEAFDEALKIERLLLFQDVKDFNRDHAGDQPLGFLLGMTRCHETFEGLPGLRRIITAELVIHDFHDRSMQNWVGFYLTHLYAPQLSHSAGA